MNFFLLDKMALKQHQELFEVKFHSKSMKMNNIGNVSNVIHQVLDEQCPIVSNMIHKSDYCCDTVSSLTDIKVQEFCFSYFMLHFRVWNCMKQFVFKT